MSTDLLGNELTPAEQRLLAVYEEMKALLSSGEELAPNVRANLQGALALMHQVVNGLAVRYEHLSDLEV